MSKSMTGFGRATGSYSSHEITVELRSVNHRFFEFNCRIPRQYAFLEEKLKSLFAAKINRGKVECYVSINVTDGCDAAVEVNTSLAKAYIDALKNANDSLGLNDDLTLSQLFRISDVFNVTKVESDEDELWKMVSETANQALESFLTMRKVEGDRLRDDILTKLVTIENTVEKIETRSPQVVNEYRNKLHNRLQELLADKSVDEARILTEAAIFADKTAVDEELVRLRSHIAQYRELLSLDEPIGKKLDFLTQEMNREVNTTGSKCSDLTITHMVVDLKSIIEKIREQIQNIE